MTDDLYKRLACPIDKTAPLKLTVFTMDGAHVDEGLLECPECGRYFQIVGRIPIMPPDEFREPSFEAPFLEKWNFRIGNRFGKGKGFTLPPENGKQTGE